LSSRVPPIKPFKESKAYEMEFCFTAVRYTVRYIRGTENVVADYLSRS